jgi:hypothetical protein
VNIENIRLKKMSVTSFIWRCLIRIRNHAIGCASDLAQN